MNWTAITGLLVSAVFFLAFLGSCVKAAVKKPVQQNPDQTDDGQKAVSTSISLTLPDAAMLSSLPDGGIVLASEDNLIIMQDGIHVSKVSKLAMEPTALAAGNNGLIYIALANYIEVYDVQGNKKAEWSETGKDGFITGVSVGETGIYAADANQRTVFRFSAEGKLLNLIDGNEFGGFTVPSARFDVATAPDGNIWVTNPGKHQVVSFSPEGDKLFAFGSPSLGWEGFNACCNPMRIAVLPDGSVITAEKGRVRVKVFSPEGKLTGIIGGTETFGFGIKTLSLSVGSDGAVYIADPQNKKIGRFTQIRSLEEFNAG